MIQTNLNTSKYLRLIKNFLPRAKYSADRYMYLKRSRWFRKIAVKRCIYSSLLILSRQTSSTRDFGCLNISLTAVQ